MRDPLYLSFIIYHLSFARNCRHRRVSGRAGNQRGLDPFENPRHILFNSFVSSVPAFFGMEVFSDGGGEALMTQTTQKIIPISRARNKKQARKFLTEAVLLIPRLVQLLFRLMRDPRVSMTNKVLVGASLAYVFSPLDIIPDFIPLAGQVDDLFVVCVVLMRLIADAGDDVIREHWTGSQDLIPWIYEAARSSKVFLPDRVVRALNEKFGGSGS